MNRTEQIAMEEAHKGEGLWSQHVSLEEEEKDTDNKR